MTFRTYVSLHGPLSRTTDTSSSQTGTGTNPLQRSSVGGSSTQRSQPTNSTSQFALTTSTQTTGGSVSSPPHLQPQPQQPHSQLTRQSYTLNMAGPVASVAAGGGVPYAVSAIPIARQAMVQHAQHGHYGPAVGSAMPTVSMGTAMAGANFTHLGQGEMPTYFSVPWAAGSGSFEAGGMPATAMTTRHYAPATAPGHQVAETGFYSPVGGFITPHHDNFHSVP